MSSPSAPSRSLQSILTEDRAELVALAVSLSFPGFVERFLADYCDALPDSESTMDTLSPALADFYNEANAIAENAADELDYARG